MFVVSSFFKSLVIHRLGPCLSSYFQLTNQRWAYFLKSKSCSEIGQYLWLFCIWLKVQSWMKSYLTQPQMGCCYVLSVSPQKIYKKDKHLILIRLCWGHIYNKNHLYKIFNFSLLKKTHVDIELNHTLINNDTLWCPNQAINMK